MDQQPYPPYQPPSPPPRSNPAAITTVLAVLGIMFVVMIIGIVFAFKSGSNMGKTASPVAVAFLTDLSAHNYTAAHALLAPGAQQSTTIKEMKNLQQYVDNQYGKLVSLGQPAWYVGNFNGQTTVQLTFNATFSSRRSRVQVVLVPSSGGYGVTSWHYN